MLVSIENDFVPFSAYEASINLNLQKLVNSVQGRTDDMLDVPIKNNSENYNSERTACFSKKKKLLIDIDDKGRFIKKKNSLMLKSVEI